MVEILTSFQKEVLKEVGKIDLSNYFVWSGEAVLSYLYLQHRKSYDLDFFSKDLLPDEYLLTQMKEIAQNLKIKKIEEHKKFNRHEFWLKRNKETLRIEFVFYPFLPIKKSIKVKEFNIKADSVEDILTNKTHAIFERAEPKDVFDVYCILLEKKIKFLRVFKWIEKKFGVEIDPVLLVARIFEGLTKLTKIKPLVIKEEFYRPDKIKEYFEKKAHGYLREKIR